VTTIPRRSADVTRLWDRLDTLYTLGGGIGANRVGGTPVEDAACDLAASWMEAAGLEVERDERGNLVGRLRGRRPELAEVWTGSHLDSVPEGGRFDGALGVVAGLEAVLAAGSQERTLGVAVFREEETGCHGSRWRVRNAPLPGAFVELHVEQGPALARAGAPLGVVTSIVAYARREVRFTGAPGHAGTTPMDARDDALCQAADYVLRVRDTAAATEGAVATVGVLEVEPGAVNVVPGAVRLTVDARAPDEAGLGRLLSELGLEPEPIVRAAAMGESVRRILREEVDRAGAPVVELPSGAGHDAGVLAAAGVASGMLFVRSLAGGVSHCPEEESSPEDVELALAVLAGALRRLAEDDQVGARLEPGR
jgi:acetylornithine deacetylase/succinyl-diaminopimelate desuccinylase-like protein